MAIHPHPLGKGPSFLISAPPQNKGSGKPSISICVNICICEFTKHPYLEFALVMLFCCHHIANANASIGPEAKLAMLVWVIASPWQTQTLSVHSTIETNDTLWIR